MNKAFILIAICSFSPLHALGKNHLNVEFKSELIHHDCQIAAGSINKQIQLGYLRKADSSPKCNAKPPFLAPQTPPKVV